MPASPEDDSDPFDQARAPVTAHADDRSRTRAWLLVALALCGISLAAPIGSATAAPALAVAFWRTAMAAVATAPVVLLTRRAELSGITRQQIASSALAGVFLALHFALWLPSLRLTGVTVSTALVVTGPVWTVAWQRLRGEFIPARVFLGIGIAFAGVLVMTGMDAGTSARALAGDLLALAGGMLAAAYTLVGEAVRRTTSTPVYTLLVYSTSALILLPVCAGAGLPLSGYATQTWIELLVLAVAAQLVGHTLLNAALPVLGATPLSMAILLEIPGASLVAWIWLGEVPALGVFPGAVLVLLGLVQVVRAQGQARAAALADSRGVV